jgi:hypothetical protein
MEAGVILMPESGLWHVPQERPFVPRLSKKGPVCGRMSRELSAALVPVVLGNN